MNNKNFNNPVRVKYWGRNTVPAVIAWDPKINKLHTDAFWNMLVMTNTVNLGRYV